MLATILNNTRDMFNMQHITPNSKGWDCSDITGGGTEKIIGPCRWQKCTRITQLKDIYLDIYIYICKSHKQSLQCNSNSVDNLFCLNQNSDKIIEANFAYTACQDLNPVVGIWTQSSRFQPTTQLFLIQYRRALVSDHSLQREML